MKKYKNTIIVSIIVTIIITVYFVFRKKAQNKGFSNSKFFSLLFAVPYQEVNQQVVTLDDFTVDEGNEIMAEFEEISSGGAW